MAYTCKDCSYRGISSGQGGACPACGSYNLVRGGTKEEAPKSARLRVSLLVALWVYLIALIIWKLNN